MKHLRFVLFIFLISFFSIPFEIYSDNQTPTVSPIYPGNQLPFRVQVELENFTLPNGLQSFASAIYKNKWLLIAGRTSGLHGFENDTNNFPPQAQNTVVYVVDPINQTVAFKSLSNPSSGLTQSQIDLLSVTSPEFHQHHKTLYLVGGYGVDSATGQFSTKDSLSAINVPGLIHWVTDGYPGETAAQYIRQITNPIFRVTGGHLVKGRKNEYLLIFGQDFQGFYFDSSNGDYTKQVRRFNIHDDGKKLSIEVKEPKPKNPDPNYRRRDLNIVPIINHLHGFPLASFLALSGVFTTSGGAWTVPVLIDTKGNSSMADPNDPLTFKQGMNNYDSATMGLYSKKGNDMYVVLFGGISYGYFENGVFNTDSELPFINQFTTIKLNEHGHFKQYIMDAQYPVILSTFSNPGNPLLFGAGAQFMPVKGLPSFKNGVLKLEKLGKEPIVVGHIVGGIQSTLPNTNSSTDSAASPYIFRVVLQPL